MRLADLIKDIPLTVSTSIPLDIRITGLTADSRLVAPGMLFVALSGTKADGMALRRGSRGARSSRDPRGG